MIKKFNNFIIPVALIFPLIFYSCASDVYDEEDIVVVRDTITIRIDTTIKEQREMEKLRLMLVIQLGAFSNKDHADNYASSVSEKLSKDADVRNVGNVYVVTVGNFTDANKAEDYLMFVKSKGYDKAFIKNIKFY
jgi:cell division septation protein DedD